MRSAMAVRLYMLWSNLANGGKNSSILPDSTVRACAALDPGYQGQGSEGC